MNYVKLSILLAFVFPVKAAFDDSQFTTCTQAAGINLMETPTVPTPHGYFHWDMMGNLSVVLYDTPKASIASAKHPTMIIQHGAAVLPNPLSTYKAALQTCVTSSGG